MKNFSCIGLIAGLILAVTFGDEDSKKIALEDEKASTGIESKEVSDRLIFGCPTDMSRNVSMLSLPLISGIELVFHDINEKGGIQGKKLVLQTADDEYNPQKTRVCVEDFLNVDKIDMFLSPVGDPTILSYLDLVKSGKLLVVFPHVASPDLHKQDFEYLIHSGSSPNEAGYVLARYALETLHAHKIVIFYQNDIPSTEGAKAYFNEKGFKDYIEVGYERVSTDFTLQSKQIREFQPDTIMLFAIPLAALEFVRQYGVANLADKHLLSWYALNTEQFKKSMKERGLQFIIASSFPNPEKSSLQIAQDFRQASEKNGLKPDIFAFEGYINARILVEILRKIEGPITKEKIIQGAAKLKDFDLGGLSLTFNPKTRTLISSMWLVLGDDEWKMVPTR